MTEVINGGQAQECTLEQPAGPVCHDDEIWAMVMFDLPVGEFFSNDESSFAEFDDGTARLTGRVTDNRDPANGGFIIDVFFEGRMSWEEWSNQDFPTSFKDECGVGGFEDWTYYLIAEGSSITGFGQFAGSQLDVIHAPVNNFFAYQVGLGANNVNASFGNGGWFIAEGDVVFNGETFPDVTTAGDFAFDGECCTSFEVVRTWEATDCSGNTSEVATQTITFEGRQVNTATDGESNLLVDNELKADGILFESNGDNITINNLAPNPASNETLLSYTLEETSHVQIEVIDRNGNMVQTISQNNAIGGLEHNQMVNTDQMQSGVYIMRINTGKEVALTKLVIIK